MTLTTNRYGQTVPSNILTNGVTISTPIYIAITNDQAKHLLNAFREVKRQQLLEAGHRPMRESTLGGVSVQDSTAPAQMAPIEADMGQTEESLRYILFGRGGIPERLLSKLMKLTGVFLFEKKDIEDTYKAWLDELYKDDTEGTGSPKQSSRSSKTRTKAKEVSSAS